MNNNQNTDEIRIKIRQFYLEILSREPDDEGLEHYLKEIQDGRLDITKLGDIFRNSQEYKLSYPTNLNSKNNSVNEIMKQDWNERARTNTLFVISTDHSDSEKDFWQSGANDCEKILGRNSDRFSNILQGKDPKKMRVLEIGCGIGRLLIPMSKIFQNVSGIDISSEMVRIGKEKTQEISNCEIVENKNNLYSKISKYIFDNKIVGHFNGKMEFGARALGNRSILANPCNPNIKDIINSKIKRRESFRPFAPAILHENKNEWFENTKLNEYMSSVESVSESKRKIIPGVTHIDGTGRVQTVTENMNSDFYLLIKKFYEISNVPIILNTSFNENEPIVMNPNEAINCFLRTDMDILVLNNFIIKR